MNNPQPPKKGHTVSSGWPSERYGPGGVSKQFNRAEDVPAGWEDHPSKVKELPKPQPMQQVPQTPKTSEGRDDRAQIIKELQKRGVGIKKNTPTSRLRSQLQGVIAAEQEADVLEDEGEEH